MFVLQVRYWLSPSSWVTIPVSFSIQPVQFSRPLVLTNNCMCNSANPVYWLEPYPESTLPFAMHTARMVAICYFAFCFT